MPRSPAALFFPAAPLLALAIGGWIDVDEPWCVDVGRGPTRPVPAVPTCPAPAVPVEPADPTVPTCGITKPVAVYNEPAGATAVTLPCLGRLGSVQLEGKTLAFTTSARSGWESAIIVALLKGKTSLMTLTPGIPQYPGLISWMLGSAVDSRSACASAIWLFSRSYTT